MLKSSDWNTTKGKKWINISQEMKLHLQCSESDPIVITIDIQKYEN